MPRHLSPVERVEHFLKQLDQSNGPYACWLWQGGGSHGYGTMKFLINGKYSTMRAHRIAFVLAGGTIPPGKLVLHRCDTPACCNPLHLFLGTHKDNSDDKIAKNRQKILQGTNNGSAKMTEEAVQEIRNLHGQVKLRELMQRFQLSEAQVLRIQSGAAWKQVPMPERLLQHRGKHAFKLTPEQVREIRTLYATGHYTTKQLGILYAVSSVNIWCIVRRKLWKYID
jgi:hypothetical protein